MIFVYIKKLFGKWFTYIGAFLTILSFAETYIKFPFFIPSEILYIVAIIAYIYASYQVWNDMRVEKESLEEKLTNPVDYEIKAYAKKLVLDLEYIEREIDKNIEEAQKIIGEISREIISLEKEPNKNSFDRLYRDFLYPSLSNDKTQENIEKMYLVDLKNYKNELEKYPLKKDECLENYKKVLENELKNIYEVKFIIKNIGIKSDKDIDVILNFGSENSHVEEKDIISSFPNCNKLPNKPARRRSANISISPPRLDYNFNLDLNPQTYRRFEEEDENGFSVKLRDLKVSEEARVLSKSKLLKIEKRDDLSFSITSENANAKIEKQIIFFEDGEIEYFKDILNGVEK